jgi:hypothetical protein
MLLNTFYFANFHHTSLNKVVIKSRTSNTMISKSDMDPVASDSRYMAQLPTFQTWFPNQELGQETPLSWAPQEVNCSREKVQPSALLPCREMSVSVEGGLQCTLFYCEFFCLCGITEGQRKTEQWGRTRQKLGRFPWAIRNGEKGLQIIQA